jgi:hypothetical protein
LDRIEESLVLQNHTLLGTVKNFSDMLLQKKIVWREEQERRKWEKLAHHVSTRNM